MRARGGRSREPLPVCERSDPGASRTPGDSRPFTTSSASRSTNPGATAHTAGHSGVVSSGSASSFLGLLIPGCQRPFERDVDHDREEVVRGLSHAFGLFGGETRSLFGLFGLDLLI